MPKWIRITKVYWFGLFVFGFVLLLLQELPYIVMPFIPLENNPLMEMQDKIAWLNVAEKMVGVSCILLMIFLVRDDENGFSLETKQERLGFYFALAALVSYYVGWALYFTGHQSLGILLGLLVAMPPIYYAFIGIWRRNTPLSFLSIVFLCVHLANVSVNLIGY